jgi:uncharacterized membrane protein YbaN (DUF454 family)
MRRAIYLTLAGAFFALAAAGAVLPGLPCTPFLLLTSFFLVRSSPRLHARLRASRRFGPVLDNWERHGGVTRRVKRTAIAATVAVSTSALLGNLPPAAVASVVFAGAVGIWVVARLPVVDS